MAARLLVLLMLVHLGLGLAYDWATPIFEASDEGAHFAVVQALASGQGLPVQQPGGPEHPWAQEGSQPPVYYWLAARLAAPIGLSDFQSLFVQNPLSAVGVPGTRHNPNLYRHPTVRPPLTGTVLAVHLVRWFSLALSLGTIWLTYQVARAAFPGRQWLALLAAAFVALNPMVLFINASVNNDNLLMLLSTAALLLTLQLMQRIGASGWRAAALLGVVLGLAALTKVSGLVLWPIAAVGLVVGEARQGVMRPAAGRMKFEVRPLARMVARALLVFGLALAISGWWYLRNRQLYGEWLGLDTMVAIAGPRDPSIGLLVLVLREWRGFFMSFWGVFGVFTILPAPWVQVFYDGLTIIAVVGGVLAIVVRRTRPSAEVAMLALFSLLTLVGVVRWTLATFASQGRLMFGAIAPLSIFLAAGLLAAARPMLRTRAGRDWEAGLVATLTAAMGLVAGVVPFAFIAPPYTPPPLVAEAGLPAELRAEHVIFGDGIELVGYTVGDEAVRPGQPMTVTLYWRALQGMVTDYKLALHVLGRQAAQVGKLDTWPGGGLAPTSQWIPGTMMADTYYLPIAATAIVPTRLQLNLYVWDDDPVRGVPARGPDGRALSSVTMVTGRAIPSKAAAYAPDMPDGSTFENGIELSGYDIATADALTLTLYWKLNSRERLPADYTVFVHLTDLQGAAITEPADSPPLAGDWPTSSWEPGHTFADDRLIALPAKLSPGRYLLGVGLYSSESGARLAAFKLDGSAWPEDTVVLSGFEVQ